MRKVIGSCTMAVLLLCTSCSTIDCPFNNMVHTVYGFYNTSGVRASLKDTLTVSTTKVSGVDSVLINKDIKVDSIRLPMSYAQQEDALYFLFKDTLGTEVTDTLRIKKTNQAHFVSPDCNPAYFHEIIGIIHTRHKIDSIVVNRRNVTYDASKEHLKVYLHSGN